MVVVAAAGMAPDVVVIRVAHGAGVSRRTRRQRRWGVGVVAQGGLWCAASHPRLVGVAPPHRTHWQGGVTIVCIMQGVVVL